MNMIVCVKQVVDPETPVAAFKIAPEAKRVIASKDRPLVISPFDEQAVEAALRVKDAQGGKVTILSLGEPPITASLATTRRWYLPS